MENKVCRHLKSFSKCNLKAKEPDGSFSDVYKVGCDLVNADEYFLSKEFSCFECSKCVINPLIDHSESKIDLDDEPTIPCELEDNKRDYDVISTSGHLKPEDMPRMAEAFASGTYIPGVPYPLPFWI